MDIFFKILSAIILIIIVSTVAAIPFYFLWNWLVPDIFGLIHINFLQALGLIFLSSCIFNQTSSKN